MIYKIILLFYIIGQNGLGLVVYDIEYGTVNIKNGKIILNTFLKSLNPFNEFQNDPIGCDTAFPDDDIEMQCDLDIYSRLCILNQSLMGLRNDSHFSGNNKYSFTVNSNQIVSTDNLLNNELVCSTVENLVEYNQNSLKYDVGNYKLLNSINEPIADIYQLTVYVGDDNFQTKQPNSVPFEIFTTTIKSGYIDFKDQWIFKKFTFVNVLKSEMSEEYVFTTECNPNTFGTKCWYKCADNYRINCNCNAKPAYIHIPCLSTCKDGWVKQYKYYLVSTYYEYTVKCNTVDICQNKLSNIVVNCSSPRICLPVDNTTYYCEYLQAYIEAGGIPENITSEVFFYEESINVKLDKSVFIHKDILINTTGTLNMSEFVFISNILIPKYELSVDGFFVNGLSSIDIKLGFGFVINLRAWEKVVIKTKVFRIYKRPMVINMYRFENKTVVNNYIYVGEMLTCYTDALPVYRNLIYWDSKYMPLTFKFGRKVKVPIDTLLGPGIIDCTCILIVKGRKNVVQSRSFNNFVKLFTYLRWNTTNNLLEINSTVKCEAHAFINFNLRIEQLDGKSQIKINQSLIKLIDIEGGSYEMVCYFLTSFGLHYSTYLKFQLRVYASAICIFLYANVFGSIVQCGHNGVLQDEYKTDIYFYAFEKWKYFIKVQGEKYLRIPYYLEGLRYKITCVVTWRKNQNRKLDFNIESVLHTTSKDHYVITDLNKLCLKFDEYVELPSSTVLSNRRIILNHLIFFLLKNDTNQIIIIPLYLLVLALPFFTLCFVVKFSFPDSEDNETILKNRSKVIIKRLKIRKINDKIRADIRKPQFLRRSEEFFRNSLINKRNSIIRMLEKLDSVN